MTDISYSRKAETECRHGIDLKNPFTMSKTQTVRLSGPCLPLVEPADFGASSSGYQRREARYGGQPVELQALFSTIRAPSVAAKLRLVARFAALAALADVRNSSRYFASSSARWWAE